jgi:hypothetical protein
MRKALFIHGTGVRSASFAKTIQLVRSQAAHQLGGWTIEGLLWGDAVGARLARNGDSIPNYALTGNAQPAQQAGEQAIWILLATDELLELRIAPDQAGKVGQPPGGPAVWAQLLQLATPTGPFEQLLMRENLLADWTTLIAEIKGRPDWQQVIQTLKIDPGLASEKVARALVASLQKGLRADSGPGLDRALRDELVQQIRTVLGGALGLMDWLKAKATKMTAARRGKLTDATGPNVGDILKYQVRGDALRKLIAHKVKETGAEAIIAHSLGGIAAVDWLIETEIPHSVKYLITVGSQAGFFYEIDALATLPEGEPLPLWFPRQWLNVYDPSDFLSYRAQPIFPGIAVDAQVDNGQPFPDSHGAYWRNPKVWDHVRNFLGA